MRVTYIISKANGHTVGFITCDETADIWGIACGKFPRLRNPDCQRLTAADITEVIAESGLPYYKVA